MEWAVASACLESCVFEEECVILKEYADLRVNQIKLMVIIKLSNYGFNLSPFLYIRSNIQVSYTRKLCLSKTVLLKYL